MFESFRATQRYHKLIRSWIAYRDMVQRFDGAKGVTDDHEKRFLKLKARIAALLPIVEGRAPGSMEREAQRRVMLMTDLLNRHRSLRREEPPNEIERDEFTKTWHEHYIFLNQLKGVPVVREQRIKQKPPQEAPSGMPTRKLRRSTPGSWFLGFVLRVGVVAVAVWLVGKALGFRWGQESGFAFEDPISLSGLGENVMATLRSLGTGIFNFMQPVTSSYGLESTIALVGVLSIALGYLVFIRGR